MEKLDKLVIAFFMGAIVVVVVQLMFYLRKKLNNTGRHF